MEEESKNIESQHSVKISINAKQQYSGEVKCYGQTPQEALKRTLENIKLLEELIRVKNG